MDALAHALLQLTAQCTLQCPEGVPSAPLCRQMLLLHVPCVVECVLYAGILHNSSRQAAPEKQPDALRQVIQLPQPLGPRRRHHRQRAPLLRRAPVGRRAAVNVRNAVQHAAQRLPGQPHVAISHDCRAGPRRGRRRGVAGVQARALDQAGRHRNSRAAPRARVHAVKTPQAWPELAMHADALAPQLPA